MMSNKTTTWSVTRFVKMYIYKLTIAKHIIDRKSYRIYTYKYKNLNL